MQLRKGFGLACKRRGLYPGGGVGGGGDLISGIKKKKFRNEPAMLMEIRF